MRRIALLLATPAFLIAGCAGSSGTAESSAEISVPPPTAASPSPTVAMVPLVNTVEDLRDAFIAAGGSCAGATAEPRDEDLNVDLVKCPDGSFLIKINDIGSARSFADGFAADDEATAVNVLVGPDWVLYSEDAAEVSKVLGGQMYADLAAAAAATEATASGSTEVEPIASGTYLVGSEMKPGYYRVNGYYARNDSDGEIIANDGVYEDDQFTLMIVKKSDDTVEISGEAMPIADFPSYDPVGNGVVDGTYLVGKDIKPGRYRIKDSDYAYGARLDKNLEIIDNEGNEGSVIITVKSSDFAFEYSGEIERI